MQVDLRKNSHSFLREAVRNAIEAESKEERWPFAILHVVQALELTLKAILAKQHPLFVYENIDAPSKTVSLTLAMDRLSKPEFGVDLLSSGERKRIAKAVELRNQITHSSFECSADYAAAKFAEVFALDIFLEARHFELEIDALVEPEALDAILGHEKSFEELHRRALERIEADNVPDDVVWECPQCEKHTFITDLVMVLIHAMRVLHSSIAFSVATVPGSCLQTIWKTFLMLSIWITKEVTTISSTTSGIGPRRLCRVRSEGSERPSRRSALKLILMTWRWDV